MINKNLLLALVDGKYECDVEYPNFRDIKVKIISIDFTNIEWRPVKVKILEKGITIETTEFEPVPFSYDRDAEMAVKKQVPFTEAWVSISWLKNYR